MTFDNVYELLRNYRTQGGEQVLFLLARDTMHSIYDCVLQSGARECLELGTGYGATTCVIAAALDELGGGRVSTIDMLVREPIGIDVLAAHTGLSRYIEVVSDNAGYNWYLADLIERRTSNNICEPCVDFCFLDGAHEWGPDALAVFLVAKLLRPGAWLALDDLDFKLRGCQPAWATVFADRSEKELDAYQLERVFNLVLRQHPDFADFAVTDGGRTGWARKKTDQPVTWAPTAQTLDPLVPDWQDSFSAKAIADQSYQSDGITTKKQGNAIRIKTTQMDPFYILPDTIAAGRSVDMVSLRVRLVTPAAETLQIFWTDAAAENFNESRSVRVKLAASDQWRDVTIRITGGKLPRPIKAIRVDPTDGPSTLLWESFAIGGWKRDEGR